MWFCSMSHSLTSRAMRNLVVHRATRKIAVLVGTSVLAALPAVASAVPIVDSAGDFLPTYTGPHDPGLDVLAHRVTLSGDRLTLFGEMAGPVGATQAVGGLYLFGVDRGQGTPRFLNSPASPPSIGPNVLWDAIVRVNANGTGAYVNSLAGVTTTLDPLDITISGNTLSVSVPLSLMLTSAIRPPQDWTYNLWPRNGVGLNVQVSDLAPDNGNSAVQVIPEPASVALCAIGVFGMLRRGRKR